MSCTSGKLNMFEYCETKFERAFDFPGKSDINPNPNPDPKPNPNPNPEPNPNPNLNTPMNSQKISFLSSRRVVRSQRKQAPKPYP